MTVCAGACRLYCMYRYLPPWLYVQVLAALTVCTDACRHYYTLYTSAHMNMWRNNTSHLIDLSTHTHAMSVHNKVKFAQALQVTTCNLLEHSRYSWNIMDCSIVMNGSASPNLQLSSITCVVTACNASYNLQASRTFQTQLECYRLFYCHEWQCKLQLATCIYHIVLSQVAMQVNNLQPSGTFQLTEPECYRICYDLDSTI
jgi:hypothetical protein